MTFPELYSVFAAMPQMGFLTNDTRYGRGYVYSLINDCKAAAQKAIYLQNRKTHPSWFIRYYPEFQAGFQKTCYGVFFMPTVIYLDEIQDGYGFIGSTETLNAMIPVKNRVSMSDIMKHPILKPRPSETYILLEGNKGEVWGNNLKEFSMSIIPADPREIPTYNEDVDEYPADPNLIDMMKKIAMNSDWVITRTGAIDRKPNYKDDTVLPVTNG